MTTKGHSNGAQQRCQSPRRVANRVASRPENGTVSLKVHRSSVGKLAIIIEFSRMPVQTQVGLFFAHLLNVRLLICLAALGLQLASLEAGALPVRPSSHRQTVTTAPHTLRARAKRGPRLRARCRLLRKKLNCSAVGRFTARSCKVVKARYRRASRTFKHTKVGQGLRYLAWQTRGQMTLLADRIELNLSPKYAGLFHRVRAFGPVALGTFAFRKFRQDPVFLAGYGTISMGLSNLQVPLLLGLGFSPLLTLGVRFITGTPVDLGVLWWRQHRQRKRQDPNLTPMGTLRQLTGEYRTYAEHRRSRARRFMRWDTYRKQRQQHAPTGQRARSGSLRGLAAPLMQ